MMKMKVTSATTLLFYYLVLLLLLLSSSSLVWGERKTEEAGIEQVKNYFESQGFVLLKNFFRGHFGDWTSREYPLILSSIVCC